MSDTRANKFQVIFISIAVIMAAMSFKGISIKDEAPLVLHFRNYVGARLLALDTVQYRNSLDQPFKVSNFKYYISNVELVRQDGTVLKAKDSYYLINQEDEKTGDITLPDVPKGDYRSISFLIGVDSLHNCNGAQEGALDPVNAMFWTWSTGYIFMKLEGKSTASKSPGALYEYHIGGYREPNNRIRNVTIDLKKRGNEPEKVAPVVDDGKSAPKAGKLKMTDIYINADVLKVFSSKNVIDISKLSSVTDLHNATMVADNYQNMFSLGYVTYGY